MLVEPSADDATAQGCIVEVLQGDFHNFSSTEKLSGNFSNDATKADRLLRTIGRERGKPGAIFIPPRIVFQQLPPRREPQALNQFSLRLRQPGELFKWLIERVRFHHFKHTPFRTGTSLTPLRSA